MTQTWASPSGSRWEPPTTAPAPAGAADPAVRPPVPATAGRRRQPVLVALVALLSLGAPS